MSYYYIIVMLYIRPIGICLRVRHSKMTKTDWKNRFRVWPKWILYFRFLFFFQQNFVFYFQQETRLNLKCVGSYFIHSPWLWKNVYHWFWTWKSTYYRQWLYVPMTVTVKEHKTRIVTVKVYVLLTVTVTYVWQWQWLYIPLTVTVTVLNWDTVHTTDSDCDWT